MAGCMEGSVQLVFHWLEQLKQDIQIQDIKTWKTNINLKHISRFGSYRAVNIPRLSYKNESRNAVKGKNRNYIYKLRPTRCNVSWIYLFLQTLYIF